MNTSQASEGNTIRAIDMAPAPFIKPPRQLSGAYTKDLGLGARDCVRSSPSRASGTGSFAGTRRKKPRSVSPTGAGYCCRIEKVVLTGYPFRSCAYRHLGYLSGGAGCVTTAAWWCHQQPPSPIVAVMMMAHAIKTRMDQFPHSLSCPEL
jgi:hypothetical protein